MVRRRIRVQGTGRIAVAALLVLAAGCDEGGGNGTPAGSGWRGRLAATVRMGSSDNAEAVRVIPGRRQALLVSSKARKITLLDTTDTNLRVQNEKALFPNDPSESELTNVDVAPDGTWAALTLTSIEVGPDGKQTKCGGRALLVDISNNDRFGTLLADVEVGPMPDSIAISGDGKRVAVANERDGPDAWGKCEVPGARASISILDVAQGPAQATEVMRIEMKDADTGPREPESIVFGQDGDLVAATLQDSHEVVFFRISELQNKASPTSDDVQIVRLPPNALGQLPWPDGITRFLDARGVEHFAVAGEWNDTFSILDDHGAIVSTTDISERDIPPDFPRVVQPDTPLFSPDTGTSFVSGGRIYLALSLRHAGAVAVYDVTDPAAPAFVQALAVGQNEQGQTDRENGSTIRPEGVSAAPDGSFLVVANEEESSASLIVPLE